MSKINTGRQLHSMEGTVRFAISYQNWYGNSEKISKSFIEIEASLPRERQLNDYEFKTFFPRETFGAEY